jgi:hypothetical protein
MLFSLSPATTSRIFFRPHFRSRQNLVIDNKSNDARGLHTMSRRPAVDWLRYQARQVGVSGVGLNQPFAGNLDTCIRKNGTQVFLPNSQSSTDMLDTVLAGTLRSPRKALSFFPMA